MTSGLEIPSENPHHEGPHQGPDVSPQAVKDKADAYYETPQWRLMWRRFRKHRVALWMLHVVIILYVLCLNCDFLSPYDPSEIHGKCVQMPPQVLHLGFVDGYTLPRLYVYPFVMVQDPVTLERHYWADRQQRTPIKWFLRGKEWSFMGLIKTDLHLFGVRESVPVRQSDAPAASPAATGAAAAGMVAGPEAPVAPAATGPYAASAAASMPSTAASMPSTAASMPTTATAPAATAPQPPTCFLLGTDKLGQDMYSRIVHGGRISLLLGLTGVLMTFVLGITMGGISGYYGGKIDIIIQRIVEILQSIPTIPIWLAMAAAIPKEWTSLQGYFAMTMILAIIGWTGLCRVVRGKLLSLREEDYARAALLAGASERRVIFVHLIPNFLSHIIASLTLAVPGMILAETSLSFLGLGLRPPIVSWGVLLQDAQSVSTVQNQPWMLLPAVMVIIAVLAFNFAGDGLRDAADPYAN